MQAILPRQRFAWCSVLGILFLGFPYSTSAQLGQFDKTPERATDEALIFTPSGFSREGVVNVADPAQAGSLNVTVRDAANGTPTPCRVNVVGPDGNYYHPEPNPLSPYSLTGEWPNRGFGNRRGKAPIRYFGRFFYTTGTFTVSVPAGQVRIEIEKGFEYRPVTWTTYVSSKAEQNVTVTIERTLPQARRGYYSGDSHLHLARATHEDEETDFDLLEAEDVRFGSILCYNLDTSSYTGIMQRQDYPQLRKLGKASLRARGDNQIMSGQEYRSGVYGHLKVFQRDSLVLPDDTLDPNHWPVFGVVARQTREAGGLAFYAHGGYAQEIYADLVQGNIDGVELLQFGIYRGIGLDGWYRILNVGYRFPAEGASDYPPCRKFADCRTYVRIAGEPSFVSWYEGLAAGRSFFTSGPVIDLEVNDRAPGDVLELSDIPAHKVEVKVEAESEVCPITHLQLIVNGKVFREIKVIPGTSTQTLAIGEAIELAGPSWIAARVFSLTPSGAADGEAHTNPVYVYENGKRPFDAASLDWLRDRIEEQTVAHSRRDFPGREKVVQYFQQSLDKLAEVKAAGGLSEDPASSQSAR